MLGFLFVVWVTALYALVFNLDSIMRVLRRTSRTFGAARAFHSHAKSVTRRA